MSGAAGGVDVVVPGDPALKGGIDPAPDLEVPAVRSGLHLDLPALGDRFGSAGEFHGVAPLGQPEALAVGPVYLGLEEEVGGQALGLRREDVAQGVGHQQRRGGGSPELVPDSQVDGMRRLTGEQGVHLAAEPQVLGTLAHVKDQLGFPRTGVAGIELEQAVLHRQSAEGRHQRLALDHVQVQPPVRHGGFRGSMQPDRLRALHPQGGSGSRLVVDLHQEGGPPALQQRGFGVARPRLDPHLRGHVDELQHVGVEDFLGPPRGLAR